MVRGLETDRDGSGMAGVQGQSPLRLWPRFPAVTAPLRGCAAERRREGHLLRVAFSV
jgi:hypothetical protein